MKYSEVLIVGAGPAGLMAGLSLAKGGIRVIVVEKRQQQDSPVACGQAVSEYFFS